MMRNMRIAELSSKKVIEAVKKRPALYDKSDKLYFCHKRHKINIWIDVCREVCSNWNKLSPHEKIELRHEVNKRWQNIRTCYAREHALQKKEKEYRFAGKRFIRTQKKYEYYDLLSFLQHDMKHSNDREPSPGPEDYIPLESVSYDEPQSSVENENESVDDSRQNETNKDENVLDLLKQIKKDESDDDRQFVLSLLPSFKKLNDRQKLEARIGILKVLQEVTYQVTEIQYESE